MTPDVVVDVGNSRMKWGRCRGGRVREKVSLRLADPASWAGQFDRWQLDGSDRWAVAGVNPPRQDEFLAWLRLRTDHVLAIDHWGFGGRLKVAVETPTQVGIDRLLTALAARTAAPPARPVVVINVGTAMTVDLVAPDDRFAGGAILPGPALMAKSLHQHTAKLPHVKIDPAVPTWEWGRNTRAAIELGIGAAITGAVDLLTWEWASRFDPPPVAFITGGDAGYFNGFEFAADVEPVTIDPLLTLEGIRIAAEGLP